MSIDIDKLEALARAATPGPWQAAGDDVIPVPNRAEGIIAWCDFAQNDLGDAQYIAAADPDAILALIARLREAEAREQALAAHVERLKDSAKRFYNATVGEPGVEVGSPIKRLVDEVNEATEELRESVEATPATSLARREARVAAEALEQLYNERQGEGMVRRGLLLDRAIELQEEADTAEEES